MISIYTNIIVYPSRVQGVGAEDDVVSGIEYFNTREDIDTIIVARGGGSIEDLAPFNTEKVVKAIYASEKPVISAVGHETDFTLCDFASDLRVPTPSVAAEVAVFDYKEQVNNIKLINDNNYYFITKTINDRKKETVNVSGSIIDKTKLKIETSKAQIMMIVKAIESKIEFIKTDRENRLSVLTGVISKLNPLEILKSGYAVVERSGKKLTTAKSVKVGDEITINLSDGKFDAKVSNIEK